MALDLKEFGSKLKRYREQLKLSLAEVAADTGIAEKRLAEFETAETGPSGDEILILADFYRCDYRFFISNERLAAFEQTENLYRRYGNEFSKEDRRRVQEFLFLCECEEFLWQELRKPKANFKATKRGSYFKGQAAEAASALRRHLGLQTNDVPSDVYQVLRRLGIHVFRRELENSNISGLTIRHPYAGDAILVNYSEDIYRQRFTAAHEAGHVFLDAEEEVVVTFGRWDRNDLVEVRANTFASQFLLPPETLTNLPVKHWSQSDIVRWANQLKVSTAALAIALREAGRISEQEYQDLSQVRIRADSKTDPELEGISDKSLTRKLELLKRGLSSPYVGLCFDAVSTGLITNAKAAEMLLVDETELYELSALFQVALHVNG